MNNSSESDHAAEFDQIANDPESWLATATELLDAVAILKQANIAQNYPDGVEPPDRYSPPLYMGTWQELMLSAFAIECLLKGLWVKKGNTIARNGKYLPVTKSDNHDLVGLMKAVAIPNQPHHDEVLERLSIISKSIGRYPIAKRAKDSMMRTWSDGRYSALSWGSGEQFYVETLIESLLKRINT